MSQTSSGIFGSHVLVYRDSAQGMLRALRLPEANHAPNENLKFECVINGIRTGAALLAEIGRQ
jgi:hypothetical protein